jgi:putative DNA primase/helicase
MASVNDDAFLQDPTGNRRFWTIECESINHTHGMDMQQVWAEVYELYLKGERWTLDSVEMAKLNESNKDFEAYNPFEEKIMDIFDWSSELNELYGYASGKFMTCTQIFESISSVSIPTKKDLNSISTAVKKITGQKIIKFNGQRGFYMPRLKFDENNYSQASRYAL